MALGTRCQTVVAFLSAAVCGVALGSCDSGTLSESDFVAPNGLAQLNRTYAMFDCKTMYKDRKNVIACMQRKGYRYSHPR